MKIWIISDTHFYHNKLKEHHNRPDDIEDKLFNFWASHIKPEDLLIHLGDVVWRMEGSVIQKIDSLPGKKVLVRGNHDNHNPAWYIERAFDFACDGFLYWYRLPNKQKKDGLNLYFTHRPLARKRSDFDFNVHGHLHVAENSHREGEVTPRPWHIPYLVEDTDWMPMLLDDFLYPHVKHRL